MTFRFLYLFLFGLVCQLPVLAEEASGLRVYLTKKMAGSNKSYVKVVDNRAWQGGPIRVGGKTYRRGLGVHADSALVFPVREEYASFYVVPGPDDAHRGLLEMKILVDDVEVYSSGPTKSNDGSSRRALNIPVKGANTLTLLVSSIEDDNAGDHASWADAHFIVPWDGEGLQPQAQAPAVTHIPREKIEPFLQEYCIECHGKSKQRGQVRFDEISWEIADNDTAQRWQDVLDQLNGGEMPPEEATQPFDDEMSEMLDSLTGTILTARKRLTDHGGEIKMRRLNQREYSNTIYDLFGFDVPLEMIPENAESSTFDTVGADQYFTSNDFEKYLDLGRKAAKEALSWTHHKKQPPTVRRYQPEEQVTQKFRDKVAELDAKMAMKKQGKTWQEMGFKDEGEAEIIFRQFWARADLPRQYLRFPLVDKGVYMTNITRLNVWAIQHVDNRADYIFRMHGGVVGDLPEHRKIINITDNFKTLGSVKMSGTPENPVTVEMRVRHSLGRRHLKVTAHEHAGFREDRKVWENRSKNPQWATAWIDWAELEGPFYPEHPSKFEEILYPEGYVPGQRSKLMHADKGPQLIGKFAYEAFRRRQPEKPYLEGLVKKYHEYRNEGMKFEHALAEVFAVILASPGFLYLEEGIPIEKDSNMLDDRELAIRLSYFLWSCPPDAELYAMAKAGGLTKSFMIKRQVERMLEDPKAEAFRDGFMSQWAELERFDAITVDPKEYPQFNEAMRIAAKQETREFFGALIAENLPVSNLINSDFVTINPLLAAHYGIAGVESKSDAFQKVKLPADSPRGGLMTQASFLTTGSNGERSSPVIRGALVMEKLLHDEPAPPPPNVPELGSATGEPRTNREMVIMHQKQAVCASCHKKMDVIGFGLENFDTIGRWRDTEKVGNKQVAIQPGGTLPGGAAFANVNELKTVLLDQKHQLAKEMVESILSYGLGRTIEFSDADDVAEILSKLKEEDYPMRSMIREVALSPLFRRQ